MQMQQQRRASTGSARRLPLALSSSSSDGAAPPGPSSSAGAAAALPPAPASVPRPPRLATFLPHDSLRATRETTDRARAAKLFAAAGLDLFRQSLAFDGVQPQHQAPRHPAVSPNLGAIPEDGDGAAAAADVSSDSQAILVLGAGALTARGEVNACVASRVEHASQLYWEVTRAYAERQANAHCYLIPVADELGKDGVRECEAIRNALAAAGISPHHIIMNCSAPNVIDNLVRLVPVLRHLHIEHVHVVVSQLYLPRVQTCVDRILRAADDMSFKTQYHVAADGLQARERAQRETIEARRSRDADRFDGELDDAVRQLRKQQHRAFEGFERNSHHSTGATRSAARTSHTSAGA